MKRIFLIGSLLLTICLSAQPYKSLFTIGKTTSWNIFSNTIPGTTTKYFSGEDTLVNNMVWKWFGKGTIERGLLREDTIAGKVWFKGINPYTNLLTDTAEKLVCDFSLNINDSFHYYYHQPYGVNKYFEGDVWLKVDSVFLFRGLKHIRFDTLGCSNLIYDKWNTPKRTIVKFVMIEGFGSNRGFHFMYNILNHWVVQCQYRDVELFYSNIYSTISDSCIVTLDVGIKENKYDEISIFPIPSSNNVKIIGNFNDEVIEYDIYDMNGKIVQFGNCNKKSNFEIGISNIVPGIYNIKCTIGTKHFVKKLIIN
jgi:hypothetical protein